MTSFTLSLTRRWGRYAVEEDGNSRAACGVCGVSAWRSGAVQPAMSGVRHLAHDWRIYADFAQALIAIARPFYAAEPISVELDQSRMRWIRRPSTYA